MDTSKLKSLLKYCPETGVFARISTGKTLGKRCNLKYYKQVNIGGNKYLLHRLAFLFMIGYIPDLVDHKDGNIHNNAWRNLRESNRSENSCNSTTKINKLGLKNISWNRSANGYCVCVEKLGRRLRGYSTNLDVAKQMAIDYRIKLHKEFARHE